MGFVVDKVTLGFVYNEHFSFSLPLIIMQVLAPSASIIRVLYDCLQDQGTWCNHHSKEISFTTDYSLFIT